MPEEKNNQTEGNSQSDVPFLTDITDSSELDEIKKIAEMLNGDEKVLLVARQSRFRPGGSKFSPNVVYATDRRIILRDPSMLGLREEIIDIPYNVITNAKIDKGFFSASVIFNAPGLFNPNLTNRNPRIKRLESDKHGQNGVIYAIPKRKAEDLIEIIRKGITQTRTATNYNAPIHPYSTPTSPSSIPPPTAPPPSTNSHHYASQPNSPPASMSSSQDSPSFSQSGNKGDKEKTRVVNIERKSQSTIVDELSKLAQLKEKGIVTEEEFNKIKARIIGKP